MLEMLETHPNLWIIDPIDGTTNYVHGLPGYTISVALYCKGKLLLALFMTPLQMNYLLLSVEKERH